MSGCGTPEDTSLAESTTEVDPDAGSRPFWVKGFDRLAAVAEPLYRPEANDRFNPVLVRETRQVVRNRLLLTVFCIYLAVLFGLAMYLIRTHPAHSSSLGIDMFRCLMLTLYATSLGATLLFSGSNIVRDSLSDDMLFYTELSVQQIVYGKLLGAAVLAAQFHLVTLPFLTFAYLLHGIDGISLFALPLSTFLSTVGFTSVAFSCLAGVKNILQALVSAILILFLAVPFIPSFALFLPASTLTATDSLGTLTGALVLAVVLVVSGAMLSVHLLDTRHDQTLATRIYFLCITYFLAGMFLCGCLGTIGAGVAFLGPLFTWYFF